MGTHTIDIEPKWEDLFRIMCDLHVDPKSISKEEFFESFRRPMELMDEIRQAQKAGKSKVIFEFTDKTSMTVKIE